MKHNPIGFFDSGVGGTTVWNALHDLLPNENTIYLADSINAPYGKKEIKQINELACKNTELLISKGCKLIVVACNTVTTNSINYLRSKYPVKFIGVEPAIKMAADNGSKIIGVLATKATLNSESFSEKCARFSDCIFVNQSGGDLVSLMESGKIDSPEVMNLLYQFCQSFQEAKIDSLVLGCSHYPYLADHLKKILPNDISIIDSSIPVAKQIQRVLITEDLINDSSAEPTHEFYSNSDLNTLNIFLRSPLTAKLLNF